MADQTEDLMRIVEKALRVFEGADVSDCQHKHNQLERFKQLHINLTTTLESAN